MISRGSPCASRSVTSVLPRHFTGAPRTAAMSLVNPAKPCAGPSWQELTGSLIQAVSDTLSQYSSLISQSSSSSRGRRTALQPGKSSAVGGAVTGGTATGRPSVRTEAMPAT